MPVISSVSTYLPIVSEVLASGFSISFNTMLTSLKYCLYSGAEDLPLALRDSHFGRASGPIYLDRIACSGREETLLSCERGSPLGFHSCDHSQEAGVRCPGQYLKMMFYLHLYDYVCFLILM